MSLNPVVVCVFWAVVLILLIVILHKVRKSAERFEGQKAPLPFSAGATMRVLGQENSVPYLESDIVYLTQMNADERRKMEAEAAQAAAEAVRDAAALSGSGSNVGGDAVGAAVKERLTAERGNASVTGIMAKTIIPTEQLTATRDAPQMWMIGDDISELKHEVSAQDPDLSTNRWTLQLQNQISDITSDNVEGKLNEDSLFQRRLANM